MKVAPALLAILLLTTGAVFAYHGIIYSYPLYLIERTPTQGLKAAIQIGTAFGCAYALRHLKNRYMP